MSSNIPCHKFLFSNIKGIYIIYYTQILPKYKGEKNSLQFPNVTAILTEKHFKDLIHYKIVA